MTEKTLDSESILSISEQLVEARERHGVSVSDMAQKLKLTIDQINALESENYHDLGPVTFVKGYIRVYCREFNLKESDIMPFFFLNEEENQTTMQSFSRRTQREAKDSRLMLFSYFLIALLIGSSIYFGVLQGRDNSSSALPILMSGQSSTESSEQTDTATLNNDTDNAELLDKQATETVDIANDSLTSKASKSDTATANSLQLDTVDNAKLSDVIVMTFRGDSWVEIFDAEGERVAFGVKKKGYIMTLEGKAPFNVVLGKHYNVDVVFNDKKVDISNFPNNRLAKFNLPLSE